MQEDNKHSALELRIKQSNRYVSLAIVCILGLCLLLFMYVGSVKQSEDTAKANQAVQAQVTIDSNVCKVYPDQELCVLARKVAANPDEVLVPKDGQDGTNGKDGKNGTNGDDGRGISRFSIATGALIVTYTDGQTQDLGPVVGKDGATGATGPAGATGAAGRSVISTDIASGNLIVTYNDGTTQNAGIVVGPKGETGAAGKDGTNGTDGKDGQAGAPGLTPTSVDTDASGNVTITYSDGSTATAGRILLPTVEIFQCNNGELTLKMSNGVAKTIPADCSPDELPLGVAKQ
jgi:hypothetical protein